MKAYLHDDTPAAPGEKHGERGPTHCGTITVDYEYQVEQWVIDLEKDEPTVVRVESPDLGREWKRDEHGKFVEVTTTRNPAEAARQTALVQAIAETIGALTDIKPCS